MVASSSVGDMLIHVTIVLLSAVFTNSRIYLVVASCPLLSYALDIIDIQHTASESGWPLQDKKKMVCVVTETLCFSLAVVVVWRKLLSLWE